MTTDTSTTLAKLTASFSTLEGKGFFTDIGSHWCITDAVDAVPEGCPYALVHQQDLEGLEEHGAIFIAYGATDELGGSLDDEALLQVGRQVQQCLVTHGLAAIWDGDISCRIRVGSEAKA
jgi:hypothetical protein